MTTGAAVVVMHSLLTRADVQSAFDEISEKFRVGGIDLCFGEHESGRLQAIFQAQSRSAYAAPEELHGTVAAHDGRGASVNRLLRGAFVPLLVIVLAVWLASTLLMSKPNHAAPGIQTYSQLQQAVKKGQPKFKEVVFNPGKRSITATESDGKTTVSVHYPSDQSAFAFEKLLDEHSVTYDSKGTGGSHGGR